MFETYWRAQIDRLQHLFRTLTTPLDPLPTQEERQAARLLATLLLAQMGIGLLLFFFDGLFNTPARLDFFLVALPVLVILYGISRTRFYVIGAWVLVAINLLVWFGLLVDMSVVDTLPASMLILPVFFASLMLSVRDTLWVALATVTGLLLIPLAIPVYGESYWVAVFFDITVIPLILVSMLLRRRDYDRLMLSEQRVKSLMEVTTEKIIVYDEAGQIVDMNGAAEQLLGRPRHDLISRSLFEFIAPDDHEKFRGLMYRMRHPALIHWISAQQTQHECQLMARPYHHGSRTLYVLTAHDVTKERVAERRRIENERRYEALFNRTADAVLITDLDGVYISVNRQALYMFRCKPGDMIGQHSSNFLDPDQLVQESISNRVMSGETLPIYERSFRRKDGATFIAEVNTMLVKDGDGKPKYMQSIVRDVSQRRQLEQQHFELALQRERMKILQTFIDDASHHFRTPLTSLKTSIYLMGRVEDTRKQTAHLDMMNMQTERLDQLINDLLMVSRLDREAAEGQNNIRIDLNRLLLQLVSEHMTMGVGSGEEHQWEFLPTTDELICQGDRSRLALAISNILHNASRYTPAGGQICVRTRRHYHLAVVEVIDNGIGMADDEKPFIFENFYRTDAARQRDSVPSGMGLSITHKIISMHRGVIHVESQIGQGSTFRIHLPLAGEAAEESAALMSAPTML